MSALHLALSLPRDLFNEPVDYRLSLPCISCLRGYVFAFFAHWQLVSLANAVI